MKRLTERDTNGTAMAACCGENCKHNFCCENGGFAECGDMDDIIDRLAAIEDILGDEYDLDELREIIQAKREGRCVVLETDRKKLEIAFNVVVKYGFCGNCKWIFEDKHCLECDCYQNGVKVIKEALFGDEAALRREQDGNNK